MYSKPSHLDRVQMRKIVLFLLVPKMWSKNAVGMEGLLFKIGIQSNAEKENKEIAIVQDTKHITCWMR